MSATTLERKTIAIEPEIYDNIAAVAAKEGKTIDEVAQSALAAAFAVARNEPSFAEMQTLVQADFDALGMTDEELDDFVNEVVHRVRRQMNEEEAHRNGHEP